MGALKVTTALFFRPGGRSTQKDGVASDVGIPSPFSRDGFGEALERSRPEFVFYLSGADAFVGDRLGRLALTKEGLRARDELVLGELRRRGLPHVTVMGGGYGKDIRDSVDVYEVTVAQTVG